jgi:hypothetical protein
MGDREQTATASILGNGRSVSDGPLAAAVTELTPDGRRV